jgi:hypothetical protein
MELGVNVACVTHASRVRALLCGDQNDSAATGLVFDAGDALVGYPWRGREQMETSTGDN